MSSSQISYTTGDDHEGSPWGVYWRGQTFTTVAAITLTSVKLKCYKTTSSGTFTVAIYATSDGKPTGAALSTADFAVSDLPTSADWYDFDLPDISLNAATMYAIVFHVTAPNMQVRDDASSPAYADGTVVYSSDSGNSWNISSTQDFLFDVWGDLAASYVDLTGTITGAGSVTGTLIATSIENLEGTISGVSSLSGTLDRKYVSKDRMSGVARLVACGNDELWYEDV